MDAIVRQAIAKWPNVPDCYGWLGLDARGSWYMRDDRIQALGPFTGVAGEGSGTARKGSRLQHEKLIDFIQRNYECDARGCWFFQNGPQRVYVELEVAPWVWRLAPGEGRAPSVTSHTGRPARVDSVWLDEQGRLLLATDIGLGLVHSLDVEAAATAVEGGCWVPAPVRAQALERQFGYRCTPKAGD